MSRMPPGSGNEFVPPSMLLATERTVYVGVCSREGRRNMGQSIWTAAGVKSFIPEEPPVQLIGIGFFLQEASHDQTSGGKYQVCILT